MGGWPRCHRRSADTKEIGFPGPFFTPRREIAPRRQEWRPLEGSAEDVGRTGYLSVVMSVQAGNLSVAAGEGVPASAHPTSLAPPLSAPMDAGEDRATPGDEGVEEREVLDQGPSAATRRPLGGE